MEIIIAILGLWVLLFLVYFWSDLRASREINAMKKRLCTCKKKEKK